MHTNALHSFAFATLKTQVKIMATKTQAKIPVVDLSNLDLKPGTKNGSQLAKMFAMHLKNQWRSQKSIIGGPKEKEKKR